MIFPRNSAAYIDLNPHAKLLNENAHTWSNFDPFAQFQGNDVRARCCNWVSVFLTYYSISLLLWPQSGSDINELEGSGAIWEASLHHITPAAQNGLPAGINIPGGQP